MEESTKAGDPEKWGNQSKGICQEQLDNKPKDCLR
jgi:hypothetical protein